MKKVKAKRPIKPLLSIEGKEVKEGDIVYSRNLGDGKEPLTVFIKNKGYRGQYWAIKTKEGNNTGCGKISQGEYGISYKPLEPLPPETPYPNHSLNFGTGSTSYNGPLPEVYNLQGYLLPF